MRPTFSFTLVGGPGVRVTVVQTEDGKLQITASVIAGGLLGDLRGLFFHVKDEGLLAGLQVSDGTSPLTAFQTGANAVGNLGGGVSMLGAARPFDAGVAFGTASTAGDDDIRSVTFTLSHASQALTLEALAGMQFGAVMTSVGAAGGARNGTIRAVGSSPVNLNPDAVDDSAGTGEEGSVAIAVLANDTDPHHDILSIQSFTQPSAGTVTRSGNELVFDAAGAFDWLAAGEQTQVTFTYTISDGRGGSDTATVTVTVAGENDLPTAEDQDYLVLEDDEDGGSVAGNLLDGASDPDASDVLQVVAVNGSDATAVEGIYGTLFWNADGSFTYVLDNARAATDALGDDEEVWESFVFTIADPHGGSDTATLTIYVAGANDAPAVADDSRSVLEDHVLTGSVAGLASDPEGDPLTFALVGPAPAGLVFNADGSYVYTPPADFDGEVSFQFRANDGSLDSNIGTVFIDVLPVNDAPTDIDLSNASVAENSPVGALVGLLSATDVDGGPASFSFVGPAGPFQIVGNRLEVAGPLDFETQSSYPVTIRADDGAGGTYDETFTITVTDVDEDPANRPPVAADDAYEVAENDAYNAWQAVDVLVNDDDPDGDPLTITAAGLIGTAPIVVSWDADQVFFYSTDSAWFGSFQIGYTVSDGRGGTDTAVISVTVTPSDDGPIAVPDYAASEIVTTGELTPILIPFATLLANDSHEDGTSFTITSVHTFHRGTATLVDTNADTVFDSVLFTPQAQPGNFFDYNSSWLAYFYYTVTDADGDTDETYVYVRVLDVNQAPDARDDVIARTASPQLIPFSALFANDEDYDSPQSGWTISGISNEQGVSVVVDNTARTVTVTYMPDHVGAYGFDYTVSDGEGGSDTASVSLNSGPQQTDPPGILYIQEDTQTWIADDELIALAGVTDPNGDNLYISGYGINPNFSILRWWWYGENALYTPVPLDFFGPTTLTFVVSDGNSLTDLTVTIDVVVTPVNDGPRDTTPAPGYAGAGYRTDGVFHGTEETDLVILKADLLADDVDPEGDGVFFAAAYTYWSMGYLVDEDATSITFRPFADVSGEGIGFYYYAQDAFGAWSDPIYVIVNLAETADPIDANDDFINRGPGATQTILAAAMLDNDFDPDVGDSKDIISVTALNGLSAITLNPDDSVSVTYETGYAGRASYSYTVQDGQGHTDTATVYLNRVPVAADDGVFTLDEGLNYVFIPYSAILGNDTDEDGDELFFVGWSWGYPGSHVYVSTGWFEGDEWGLRAYLIDPDYTGPAEFRYQAWDGVAYSNIATVHLNSVGGNDAPVGQTDYWFYNGAAYGDRNPASNDMAGTEDEVLEFPAIRLIQGQFIGGWYQTGRDTDEEGDPLAIVPGSLSSPWGTVELFDNAGEDWIRFTPDPDVNSGHPGGWWEDWYRIYITYRVTDGARESADTTAYLWLEPADDQPDAVDDAFEVVGNGPWVLAIGNPYSPYWVLANDRSPDDFPYGIGDGFTTIIDVAPVSGIASLSWSGWSVVVTRDDSGDPVVFSYTIQDSDGDTDTAFVTLNPGGAAPQRFYFSGYSLYGGRELWMHEPEPFGSGFATMVDEAETGSAEDNGHPREITALGSSVFWRGTVSGEGDGGPYSYEAWHVYRPELGWLIVSYNVDEGAFDAALPADQQNLGVRAGNLFWGADWLDGLAAWDESGTWIAGVWLPGSDRHLLTDAGGQPAYAASFENSFWNPVTETWDSIVNEQLFGILPAGGGWSTLQLTYNASPGNDIREIAAAAIVEDPGSPGSYAKTFYFAGDFSNSWQGGHSNGLWRVTTTNNFGWGWTSGNEAELISSETAAASPYRLTMAKVTDGGAGLRDVLFWFQLDEFGNGEIAARYDDYFGGFGVSTRSSFLGEGFEGREIRQWQDGVIFSGHSSFDGADFVALWTDADGDFFFDLIAIEYGLAGVVEQLVVDGLGNAAWILDDDVGDGIWLWNGSALSLIDLRAGSEITELQLAGGSLVYVAEGPGGFPTLFRHDVASGLTWEVPTDEVTVDGNYAPAQLTPVPDPLDHLRMIEAWYGGGGGGEVV